MTAALTREDLRPARHGASGQPEWMRPLGPPAALLVCDPRTDSELLAICDLLDLGLLRVWPHLIARGSQELWQPRLSAVRAQDGRVTFQVTDAERARVPAGADLDTLLAAVNRTAR